MGNFLLWITIVYFGYKFLEKNTSIVLPIIPGGLINDGTTPVVPVVPTVPQVSATLMSPSGTTLARGVYRVPLIVNVVGGIPVQVDFWWGDGEELMETVYMPPWQMQWSLDPYWTPAGPNVITAVVTLSDGTILEPSIVINATG
jgi:hypothetical protein